MNSIFEYSSITYSEIEVILTFRWFSQIFGKFNPWYVIKPFPLLVILQIV